MSATCHDCGRTIRDGESAWASDWNVIDVSGKRVGLYTETRYTCDECEAKRCWPTHPAEQPERGES